MEVDLPVLQPQELSFDAKRFRPVGPGPDLRGVGLCVRDINGCALNGGVGRSGKEFASCDKTYLTCLTGRSRIRLPVRFRICFAVVSHCYYGP